MFRLLLKQHRLVPPDGYYELAKARTPIRPGYDNTAPAWSIFRWVVANRLPAVNQVPFFRVAGSLTNVVEVDMDMRRAVLDRVILAHMPFKPLVHIASLRHVDRNPSPVLGLSGINEIAG